MSGEKRAVLIAGPTASGKSAFALEHAKNTDGVIVNTDSMQVYAVLDVLSARPQPEELARAPHDLYGFVDPGERFSTGAWLNGVRQVMAENPARALIFVGGTGLYFEALINGISSVPPVPEEIVSQWNEKIAGLDRAARQDVLTQHDPEMAVRLAEPDPQRVVRALSVLEHTGRSLALWQDEEQAGLLSGYELERIVLNPDRDLLRERIAKRFDWMVKNGAADEVKALLALELDPSLPAMKAIGIRELADWLAGEIDLERASELAVIASSQYAKRQRTWFRKRMSDWQWRD